MALTEDSATALHGKVYELPVPLMDGRTHSWDALAGEEDGAIVYYCALALIEKNGLFAESHFDVPLETAAFRHGMGTAPAAEPGYSAMIEDEDKVMVPCTFASRYLSLYSR